MDEKEFLDKHPLIAEAADFCEEYLEFLNKRITGEYYIYSKSYNGYRDSYRIIVSKRDTGERTGFFLEQKLNSNIILGLPQNKHKLKDLKTKLEIDKFEHGVACYLNNIDDLLSFLNIVFDQDDLSYEEIKKMKHAELDFINVTQDAIAKLIRLRDMYTLMNVESKYNVENVMSKDNAFLKVDELFNKIYQVRKEMHEKLDRTITILGSHEVIIPNEVKELINTLDNIDVTFAMLDVKKEVTYFDKGTLREIVFEYNSENIIIRMHFETNTDNLLKRISVINLLDNNIGFKQRYTKTLEQALDFLNKFTTNIHLIYENAMEGKNHKIKY